ncbi:hypothetical protein LINPERPRIM_LOCUS8496 [Linum perenne]
MVMILTLTTILGLPIQIRLPLVFSQLLLNLYLASPFFAQALPGTTVGWRPFSHQIQFLTSFKSLS